MFEDQLPTPYNNAAMAPARKAYFDTLQKEFAEEEPTPLGEITPTDENINEAMKAYRQMLNVTPEEQATKQQIQRQLALDPIRDFLNPQLQKVYGKGLKLPEEPGIEASPTTKQRLLRGLKNTAFALPSMVGLPILYPFIKTEAGARQQAEKQYNLSRQDTSQLLAEQARQQQDRRADFQGKMQLLNPFLSAPLKKAEYQRKLQEDRNRSRMALMNMASRLSDQDMRAFGEDFKQDLKLREYQLDLKKDARAQEKHEGEVNTSLNALADIKTAKTLGKPIDQLTRYEKAEQRVNEFLNYHNRLRPPSTASSVQSFAPKTGMYVVRDPSSRIGVKLVQADSIIEKNKLSNTYGRTILGPEGRPINGTYVGSTDSDSVKDFRNFASAISLGDRFVGALTDYLYASPNVPKLYGGVQGRLREFYAQFSKNYPAEAALADIYQQNMGLQHVRTMYAGRPNLLVVQNITGSLGTAKDEREAALFKGLSNKLILELWFRDKYVEGKGDDPREYDQNLPAKINDAMNSYIQAWRTWKPGKEKPMIPSVDAIANGTYAPIVESKEEREYREQVRKRLGGR